MKLKIEGKLKDGFFEWWIKNYFLNYASIPFSLLPQSAQFGLLQEYADTLEQRVCIKWNVNGFFPSINRESTWDKGGTIRGYNSRLEAMTAAIEKLNKIVNQ